jgi:hypothetical protein
VTGSRADRILARQDARAHAEAIRNEFVDREPDEVEALASDPLDWVDGWHEVDLVILDAGTIDADASDCAIAGGYQAGPPARIGVVSASVARMNFTVLHELAHHLQRTSDVLSDALGERDDVGAALEEAAADAFAASILIPKTEAVRVLGNSTPRAADVEKLWLALPNASRHAVIVRAAQNLDAPGHVILLDETGTVVFAAAHNAVRLRTGSNQSRTAIGREMAKSSRPTVMSRTRFNFGKYEVGDTMYAQAGPMGSGYTVVVASVERVPWTMSVNKPEYVPYGEWHVCEYPACAHVFLASGAVCSECKQPKCPECGRCACANLAEFTCTGCFLIKSPADESDTRGVCKECV